MTSSKIVPGLSFPRTVWLDAYQISTPPYNAPEDDGRRLRWAARQASLVWRVANGVVGQPLADLPPAQPTIESEPGIDSQCFQLAVLDKALELDLDNMRRRSDINAPRSQRGRYRNLKEWMDVTDIMIREAYDLAKTSLSDRSSSPSFSPPPYSAVYSVIRPALTYLVSDKQVRPRVPPRDMYDLSVLGRFDPNKRVVDVRIVRQTFDLYQPTSDRHADTGRRRETPPAAKIDDDDPLPQGWRIVKDVVGDESDITPPRKRKSAPEGAATDSSPSTDGKSIPGSGSLDSIGPGSLASVPDTDIRTPEKNHSPPSPTRPRKRTRSDKPPPEDPDSSS